MRLQKEAIKIEDTEMRKKWLQKYDGRYYFWCPGCESIHCVSVKIHKWNSSLEKPTFNPSVLSTWTEGDPAVKKTCHSYVRDGQIQFLSDCTHKLAGQTVDLPEHTEWPDWARQDLKQ